VQCDYHDAGRCASCTLMGRPYDDQVRDLQADVARALSDHVSPQVWEAPARGPESGFRNKAKLVVGGRRGAPTFGILDGRRQGVDLRHCGLYEPGLHAAVRHLAGWVSELGLTPYDVPSRNGELKHVLVTHSPDGEQMVRLVLRSPGQLPRVRGGLHDLRQRLPSARVVSVNLLPEHKAVLEGDDELLVSEAGSLPMRLNGLTLHLRPRSFFQTNTAVAAALYRQAAQWAGDTGAEHVWDLYSGVGGFALHLARALPGAAEVTGVEVSAEAVASARLSAAELAVDGRVAFVAGDASDHVVGREPPGVLVLNPPRRGVGEQMSRWVEDAGLPHLLYSSCNARTLATDLARMPSLRVVRARMFAMFPQTRHHEVLVLLARAGAQAGS
jgi:23S rRNA (uracil747-C5)-methyltransferase